MIRRRTFRAAGAALVLLLVALSAAAQLQTGNIFGTVRDKDGAALPGVTVTLTGGGAPADTVTDALGRFRFLNLSPASYSLKAELAGFGSASRAGITVNIGRNSEVTMVLNPAVSETITVTAEAPLLDVRRTGTGATVTNAELDQVPTARDPWVILQQVPGVLMDRINVGGNESGQQSNFVSKGATTDQATYSVDGVNTTDMISTGGSSSYYDFAAFDEVQVTTGGTDPRVQTPGAQVNMVTRRGTNDFSGSARYYLTPGSTQSEASVPAEARSYLLRTNEIDQVTDLGAEAGGPVIRDHLWLWGAWADNRVDLFTAQPVGSTAAYSDRTILKTMNGKLNAQVTHNNSATFFWYQNTKDKFGRNASPTRPPETTWNQHGPTPTWKVEDTHIFSPNFYLTGLYSQVKGGFILAANSGANCKTLDCVRQSATPSWVIDNSTGVSRNTYVSYDNSRPQTQYRADGSAFFNTGSLAHELKFGFGYRSAGAEGTSLFPNNQLIIDLEPGAGGIGLTYFYAVGPYNYEYKYDDAYLGDTLLLGNLTLQAGLRWDRQNAHAGDQVGPVNATIPEYLPQLSIAGGDIQQMTWSSISPRIGLTYALGADRKTLVRGAYNRYVGQMGSNTTGYTTTIPVNYRYIGFYTYDANADDVITRDEILFDYGIYGTPYGFDPAHPEAIQQLTRVDGDIAPPTTDEFIVGFERELTTNFVAAVNYTHRKMGNFVGTRREKTQGAGDFYTSADYEKIGTITRPDGVTEVGPYSIDIYDVIGGALSPYKVLTNLDDYTQDYDGLEMSLVKRMSSRWMMRGNLSLNDWTQNVGPNYTGDPTPIRTASGCSNCDGAEVVQGSGSTSGAKGGVWINSRWAVNVAGVYQIPGIETNLGANFTMRQGYPILYAHQVSIPSLGRTSVLVGEVGANRLPNPYSLDLRLAKEFRFSGVGVELSADAFNVTNNRVELQRNPDLARGTAALSARNRIRELQSPRILRFGARVTF